MKKAPFLVIIGALLLSILLALVTACTPGSGSGNETASPSGDTGARTSPSSPPVGPGNTVGVPDDGDAWRISVIGPGNEVAWSFTETALINALTDRTALPSGVPGQFAHIFSTINNWPAARFYAADGYSVASILTIAGLYEAAQTITFRGNDGYEISLTRDQLLAPQFFFPQVNENENGAEPVYPVIAYRWRGGTDDIGAIRDENPCLIIGQRNPFEHTNPAYVENISEIVVSTDPCQAWAMASTFPAPGSIGVGETVKLQHEFYGLVKLHYTLDGSDPTMLSSVYNPSTYQPELNVPIPIDGPTEIRVIVHGYGKLDSDIAVFEFTPIG